MKAGSSHIGAENVVKMTKWTEKLHNLDATEAKEFILGQSSTVEEVFLSHQHPLQETTSELDVCNNTVSKPPTSPKGAVEVFDFGTDKNGPNCYQVCLSSVVIIGVTCFVVVICRDLIKDILVWLASVHIGVSVVIFLLLFVVVSYPMAWGMILLMIACGYLYGYIFGPLVVELCSACGIAVAQVTMKTMCRSFIIRKFYNEKMTAVINVVGGKHGFKVVALTRLTPIPFGLQNSLFSVSITKGIPPNGKQKYYETHDHCRLRTDRTNVRSYLSLDWYLHNTVNPRYNDSICSQRRCH